MPETRGSQNSEILSNLRLKIDDGQNLTLHSSPREQSRKTTDDLPDLSDLSTPPTQNNIKFNASPGGLSLENRSKTQTVIVAPEYSVQTGASLRLSYALTFGDRAAVGVLMTNGHNKSEVIGNLGLKIDDGQRIILTVGQLKQNIDYFFLSGKERAEMTQNSAGLSYQYQVGSGFFRQIEANGYLAQAASRDFPDKTYAIENTTLYELWNDRRRIAGSTVSGLQMRLGFSPIYGSARSQWNLEPRENLSLIRAKRLLLRQSLSQAVLDSRCIF